MSTYRAPLRDMRFVIEELVGLRDIRALPGCAAVTSDLVSDVFGEASKFASQVLAPLNRVGDEQGAQLIDGEVRTPPGFKQAYEQFVAGGWNGLSGEACYGGQGLPNLVAMPVQEMWNSANLAFCLCPMLTSGVMDALTLTGTPEQRATYLPRLTAGEWTGTMNLTEPQAGSDLSAVRTRAVRESGHYRIHGTKIFITWGEHDLARNIVHLVLARTPDAPQGVKGISLFLVPKFLVGADGALGARNDVHCLSLEHKLGIHASPTCVLAYGEHEGAIGYLVGEENRGLEYMFIMMNQARLAVGLEGVALAERAYQQARAYAQTRVQGRAIGQTSEERVAIIRHPDVKRMLASMKAHTEAMRALAYSAAAALDKSRRHPDDGERKRNQALVDFLIPIVKGWCTECGVEVASTGVQVHGGMGYIEDTGAAQLLRDARITTIYEGTTGIQAADLVGRKLARERGATAHALIGEMRSLLPQLAGCANAAVAVAHAALAQAIEDLSAATRWVVDTQSSDPAAVAAVSVPFLRLWGVAAGGWLMARAALIADVRLNADVEPEFYAAKIATARYYAEHILPQSSLLAKIVVGGAQSVLAFSEQQF